MRHSLIAFTCDVCGADSGPIKPGDTSWGSQVLLDAYRIGEACPTCREGLATIEREAEEKRRLFIAQRSKA